MIFIKCIQLIDYYKMFCRTIVQVYEVTQQHILKKQEDKNEKKKTKKPPKTMSFVANSLKKRL